MNDPFDRLEAALADRYSLEREIGQGGMATVFLARDLKHRRPVAIKVLDPDVASEVGPERFLREIEIAAGLQHPNILPLHDSGASDSLLFYVMPYVEGESLADRIDREGRLPLEDALRIRRTSLSPEVTRSSRTSASPGRSPRPAARVSRKPAKRLEPRLT
jgi:serine/threonine-protein kinase